MSKLLTQGTGTTEFEELSSGFTNLFEKHLNRNFEANLHEWYQSLGPKERRLYEQIRLCDEELFGDLKPLIKRHDRFDDFLQLTAVKIRILIDFANLLAIKEPFDLEQFFPDSIKKFEQFSLDAYFPAVRQRLTCFLFSFFGFELSFH